MSSMIASRDPLHRVLLLAALVGACLVAPVRAHAAARDSVQVESAPAPFLTRPKPAPTRTPPPITADEDTAIVNARRRAAEEFGRGLMFEEQHAYAAAIVSYNNAAKHDPQLRGPSYRMGLLFASRQQYDPAARAFREELRRDPESVPANMEFALALCELGDTTRASRMLEKLVRRAPSNPEVWRALGFVRGRSGDSAGAEKALRGAVGLKPGYAKAWRDLGVVLAATGRDADARDAYRRALDVDPDDESALINAANLESRMGNPTRAIALYHRAEEVDSLQAWAYRGQIREWVGLGREDQAGEVWKRWLAVAGGDAEVREGAVRHFARQNRIDVALSIAREGVRVSPKSGEAWWLLAETTSETADTRGALDAYRRAITLFRKPEDRARAERGLRELRAAAPDSLRTVFEADSLQALRDAAADSTRTR